MPLQADIVQPMLVLLTLPLGLQVAVLQAIENDINVRIWYTDLEMQAGLLFCACRGTTRVADPIGEPT